MTTVLRGEKKHFFTRFSNKKPQIDLFERSKGKNSQMAGQWGKGDQWGKDPVFGRTQTQWDDEGDGDVKVKRRANNIEKSAKYHARRDSVPSYSKFKPQYVDSHGREYQIVSFLDDKDKEFEVPPMDDFIQIKRVLLTLRMPIAQHYSEPLPEPMGEALELFHVESQVLCTGTTDGVYVDGPTARTGKVYVLNFETHGTVSDPEPYIAWLSAHKTTEKQWF